ncbi:hypothetical protein PC116_g34295 [Phytophthora cactorum]|nr:hypothetical protein PC116_g34295 [Phytophthora cactorum]
MMPTFPFARPARIRQDSSAPNDRENPNPTFASTDTASPPTIDRRRPCRSDSRPHGRLTRNCARGNAATNRPENSDIRAAAAASTDSGVWFPLPSSPAPGEDGAEGGRTERTR